MATRSLRILLKFERTDGVVSRLWDGSGPFVDGTGAIWSGAGLVTGLDAVEQAINGDASGLSLALSGVTSETADRIWQFDQAGGLIGATLQILIQACRADDQPSGAPRILFTGRVDNVLFEDSGQGDRAVGTVTVTVTNRFTLRRAVNGSVLSDADQRARSSVLNPDAAPDRFAERVPLMQTKTIVWPRFS